MSETFPVTIKHRDRTQTLDIDASQTILDAAIAAGLDLPFSCSAGVCTTCAAQVEAGTIDQSEGMGIAPELQKEGYALLCVAYPRSAVTLVTEKEDEVYDKQFGI
ncbi:MAG: 2Fe-2S iron-sulfur cluster-binding protein [Cyanobacteria bacterium J06648_11]